MGSDTIAFALMGFDAKGIDADDIDALRLAERNYNRLQQDTAFRGSTEFRNATIQSVYAPIIGSIDCISSHQALDLADRKGLAEFAAYAAKIMCPKGCLSVGIRSTETQTFAKKVLCEVFEPDFDTFKMFKSRSSRTNLIYMLARRKDQEQTP
ncbi:MAG: hypothetical protein KGI97_05080 [Alphaproteobacteria bacterium]|nr:hypothetical protein [Alphaproteobacteria bacterium]